MSYLWRHSLLTFLSASCVPSVLSTTVPESVDVAVIGAGLAGLTAAQHLLDAGKSVIVLEARNRVGGKVYNQPLKNGGVTEVGAEFVGPTQDAVLALIKELGLETFDTYNQGKSVFWRNNTRTAYAADPQLGVIPPVGEDALIQIATTQAELDGWAATINTSAPWEHAQAAEWDKQTFEQYLASAALVADAHLVLSTALKGILSVEPREVSLLYVLAYIAAAGNETTVGDLTRLVDVTDAAQEKRVVGGTGLIPTRLAEKVGTKHIALNAAVSCVTKSAKGYTITSQAGTVRAKKVVLALAPPLVNRIQFSPPLPASRQRLNKEMRMATIGKGIPIYDTPFWRTQENLNAQVFSDRGSVRVTFDSTPEDTAFGAILGFILGDEIRAIDKLAPKAAQKQILSDYTRYFGKSAANITEFVLYRWDLEEYSWGGPVAIAPPNMLSRYGSALRKSVDGLHFAGTETSIYWTGYMDGAIRSGQRVAKEIVGA